MDREETHKALRASMNKAVDAQRDGVCIGVCVYLGVCVVCISNLSLSVSLFFFLSPLSLSLSVCVCDCVFVWCAGVFLKPVVESALAKRRREKKERTERERREEERENKETGGK